MIAIPALLLFLQTAPPAEVATPNERDHYVISIPKGSDDGLGIKDGDAGPGRLLLFFIKDGARGPRGEPMDAPFYSKPQPLASVDLPSLKPGTSVTIDGKTLAWPNSLDSLDGSFRVQAVYRRNSQARSHLAEGNIYSTTKTIDLSPARGDDTTLVLDQVYHDEPLPEKQNLKWFSMKSDILSAALGHTVTMRAGVVFPRDYDKLDAKRRIWPTIYVIPGFGGDHTMAAHYASMMTTRGTEAIAPQAVYVVLDPDCRLGHHGFADSDNNGPRGAALVKEFIPALEKRFRLEPKPEARIVTGHSSGGWSSLWLQLNYPETFGACYSSAPDPVDFSAFQLADLYRDKSLMTDTEGREQASFRQPLGPSDDRVMMTVREETGVEHILGPKNDSGEQWGAWASMFSARDPKTGLPSRMFNVESGAIDRTVVENEWSRYDITRLVEKDWAKYGPILAKNVHLVCGDRDSYYLNRAVERLRDKVESLRKRDVDAGRKPLTGSGYIEIVPRATHETIVPLTTMRFNTEMIEHLKRHGLHE
ncbi:MAG: alpha/beta hydrolase-fold protein [Phycisphaerae bacterium]|nr:alpha/beta hydrolase-fold protein [Phycisphaerae bacterium]